MLTSVRSFVQGNFSDWASLSVIFSPSVLCSSFIGPLIVTMLPKFVQLLNDRLSHLCTNTRRARTLVLLPWCSTAWCTQHIIKEFSQYWCISDDVHGCMHAWTWALPSVDAPLSYLPIFPGGSDGKASACSAGDQSLISGLGWSPEGNGNPLQYSCLENPMREEPGRLHSMGLQRVGHDWATSLSLFTFIFSRYFWFLHICSWHFESLVDTCLCNIDSLAPDFAGIFSFVTSQLRHKPHTYHNPLVSFHGFSGFGENLRSCLPLLPTLASFHWLFFSLCLSQFPLPSCLFLFYSSSVTASHPMQDHLGEAMIPTHICDPPDPFSTKVDLVQDEV